MNSERNQEHCHDRNNFQKQKAITDEVMNIEAKEIEEHYILSGKY